ncbi:NADPH:quinone oxidoreductase family protein [Bradyrhizobium lablabi]|uniref:NADPH:quinone oxidoreductase family protein n=1 Tax=Bradyrhizobium lablabi TaxID=722472 RepID=UPI001BA821DA|nr:NADPH:quinone oxidoreductase family protein [Bradyrhizobium lablabi]MBR0693420.1 NADPH:quinone oxidoreductase family protein [Bradyrhizobium lablabi]
MRAVLCNGFHGIKALSIGEAAEPQPEADEVLIDVHAACVSFADYLMICGGYQKRPALPYVPGMDAAGVVVACGENVQRFLPGDRVACGAWFGSLAERMTAKASFSARLPENADFVVGSAIQHGYVTAWYALVDRARLQAGETILVTGAAGGVGLACIELARLLGARVIAAVGSATKTSVVREYGADEVIDYSSEDVRERVKALTDGEGLDICFENVGGPLFGTLARLMRWNGRLIPIGFTSGEIPSLPMNLPLLKNYSIVGAFTGAWAERFPDERARAADTIMGWVAEGKLHPRIDRVLPLEQTADAMTAIADRSVQGRVVLRVR